MTAQLNLVVLGKQGAGKGTQSQRLCELHDLAHISTGDMLRAAVQEGTPLGNEVKSVLDAGTLVSDELVNRLVEERFQKPDAAKGAVLDGFPRNIAQAEALDALLVANPIALCVSLELPNELVIERLSSRRVCQECGTVYKDTDPAAISGTCEVCGGDVVQRSDDQPDAIRKRLEIFERDTKPLLAFYGAKGVLVSVNGDQTPEAVTNDIEAILAERHLA
jgi:adenylate kinase